MAFVDGQLVLLVYCNSDSEILAAVVSALFIFFILFIFILFIFMLSLELWSCLSDFLLSSRRCTRLATAYITGYGLRPDRLM